MSDSRDVRFPGNSTRRIDPVDTHKVDPTEIREVHRVLSTFPPTSEVAFILRDVLDGITWAVATNDGDTEVTITRTMGV